jgi:hypothetical protein
LLVAVHRYDKSFPFFPSLPVEKAEEEAVKIGLVNAPHLVSFAKN